MSGGKGGSTTSQVQIPEYIEAAAQRNLNKAERISQLGYVPYYGPDVAALTPMQQASMQNVAGAAGAFGLSAPTGQDIYGMPAPTEYAGGIQGYSSAPMFEQAQAELAARRPAQKSYIDSFFIDPFTGAYGSGAQPAIDYTNYATGAQQQREQQAFDLAMSGRAAGSALSQAEFDQNAAVIGNVIGDPTYDGTRVLTTAERAAVAGSPAAQLAQDTIYMNQLAGEARGLRDLPDMLMGNEPTFENPSSTGSYGGSLVTGGLSGDFTPIPGLTGEIADSVIANVAPEYAMGKQGEAMAKAAGSTKKDNGLYDTSSWFTDTSPKGTGTGPTNTALAEKVSGFQTAYDPSTYNTQVAPVAGPDAIAYGGSLAEETGLITSDLEGDAFWDALESDPTLDPYINYGSSNDNDSYTPVSTTSSGATVIPTGTTIATGTVLNSASDPVVNVGGTLYNQSNAPAPAPAPSGGGNDDGGGGNDDGGGGGCVVATHAVNSGAFTPSMKREAVVWCMHNLHDKWWGEAIRRGYRHLGRKKIEQGKAHEHYQEFRNYIDFASGKKRTIKGAIHFAARTVQFFAVGLIKGDA